MPFRLPANPLADATRLGMDMMQMAVEAQTVIGLRMLGLAGLWPVARSEATEMILEKPVAFARAAVDAGMAAASGKGPFAVAEAALRPIAARTHANSARLTRATGW